MNALGFTLTCGHCSGELEVLAPCTARGQVSQIMVKCLEPHCRREWLIRCVMEQTRRPESVRRADSRQLTLVPA